MENIKKPSWFLHLTEFPRSIYELVRGWLFLTLNRNFKTPQGNRTPVLILPGLLGSDNSTALLRRYLKRLNYETYGWGLGRNLGDVEQLKTLNLEIAELSKIHQQKIILIGWSLGGIYARELAKQQPQFIKKVITLGSPFASVSAPNHAMWVFKYFNKVEKIDKVWWDQIPVPATVPTTAIYSKTDGIVPWEACMEQHENATHQNLMIPCCHLGFCVNPDVMKTIPTLF